MNYEDIYSEYLIKEKELRECITNQQKCFKRLVKEMENGDIKNAQKDLSALRESSRLFDLANEAIFNLTQSFDVNAYISDGQFAEQMLMYCEKLGVDAIGENNSYELFPYKVKLDGENAEVTLDRKKVPYLRPLSLVKFIKTQIDRIMATSFNPSAFLEELVEAYDISIIVFSDRKKRDTARNSAVYLTDLYKYLTPMKRFRKDYDMQSFAFDIARLYSSDIEKTDDGRSFQFGPSRKNDKAIRVLDKNSQERFLSTVRFFLAQED